MTEGDGRGGGLLLTLRGCLGVAATLTPGSCPGQAPTLSLKRDLCVTRRRLPGRPLTPTLSPRRGSKSGRTFEDEGRFAKVSQGRGKKISTALWRLTLHTVALPRAGTTGVSLRWLAGVRRGGFGRGGGCPRGVGLRECSCRPGGCSVDSGRRRSSGGRPGR